MKQYKLKDLITDKITGEWGVEPLSIEDSVNVIRTTNFTNEGKINYKNIVKRHIKSSKISKKKLKKHDIIIEKSGGSPTQPVGRVVFFDQSDSEIFLSNNFTTVLRPNQEIVYPQYLFYKLWYNHIIGKTLKFQNKTTGIINLKLNEYLNEKISIIENLEDQQKIAHILSKAEALIQKRKETIGLLDEFLKSTFLDMFGDPVKNPKNFQIVSVSEISTAIKDGPHVSPKYVEEGVPILSTRNVRPHKLILEEMKYVSEDTYLELTKRFKPQFGDVLITKGGTTGFAKVVNFDFKFCIWVHLAIVRLKSNVNPIYFEHAFNSDFCYFQSQKFTHGITNKDLGLTRIAKIKLPLPPFQLQTQFAKIVEKVESIKKQQEASLRDIENLYHSLMQRAFKGELALSSIKKEYLEKEMVIKNEVEKWLNSKFIEEQEEDTEDNKYYDVSDNFTFYFQKTTIKYGPREQIEFNYTIGDDILTNLFAKKLSFTFHEFLEIVEECFIVFNYEDLWSFIFKRLQAFDNVRLHQLYSDIDMEGGGKLYFFYGDKSIFPLKPDEIQKLFPLSIGEL